MNKKNINENMNFNSKQEYAINADLEHNYFVLAGAGSGKTMVLTNRIAYLNKEFNIKLSNILALTFTNKSALEMKERIFKILEIDSNIYSPFYFWIGTFHGIFHKILKKHYSFLDLKSDFSIIDSQEQLKLITDVLESFNLDKKKLAKYVQNNINNLKNIGLSYSNLQGVEKEVLFFNKFHFNEDYKFQKINSELFISVYKSYELHKSLYNVLDFNDLLLLSYKLLLNNLSLREYYQNKFKAILIDEFQDTNSLQYNLIKLLYKKNHNTIMAVGDDDQSIYGWRGANIDNIFNFKQDFFPVKIIKLEQNYRSTNHILDAANEVITKNIKRMPKSLYSDLGLGNKIICNKASSDQEEANFVVRKIKYFVKKPNYKLNDIAILYRNNSLSRVLEKTLSRENIPYIIYGNINFYERAEIKNVLSYIKLIVSKNDNLAFERVINFPSRGFGISTLNIIKDYSNKNKVSYFKALEELYELNFFTGKVKNSAYEFLNFFTEIENIIKNNQDRYNANEFIKSEENLFNLEINNNEYLETIFKYTIFKNNIYKHYMEEDKKEKSTRVFNIQELISEIKDFENLYISNDYKEIISDFLSNIALDLSFKSKKNVDDIDKVKLMTVHSSKGLEFDTVFICGLENNLFPSYQSLKKDDTDEERRLFYVAITRAKRNLFLSYCSNRNIYGNNISQTKSTFLDDISDKNIFFNNNDEKIKNFGYSSNINKVHYKYDENQEYQINDKVNHTRFGKGIIKKVEGLGEDSYLYIYFKSNFQTKKFKANSKNLEKLN